jgi:uncharacterized protein (TIGR02246 family)
MKTSTVIVLTMLAISTRAGAAPPPGANPSDLKAIEKLTTDWVAAWNQHDAKGMAAVFSPDGDFINPMGERANGRPEIAALFEREHTGDLKHSTVALACEPARFFDATVAEVNCTADVKGVIGPKAPKVLHALMTVVVMQDGEHWGIESGRAMFPSKPPGSAKPEARAGPINPR